MSIIVKVFQSPKTRIATKSRRPAWQEFIQY